jgi:hypothetical protein
MDFFSIVISMNQCFRSSNTLYESIRIRPEIQDKVKFAPNNKDINTFRIEFIRPEGCVHGIYGLSISYPYDAIGNRGSNYGEGFPSTIETAILGEIPQNLDIFHANFINDKNCGYQDVCHFYDNNVDALVEEIIRISNYLLSPLLED